MEHDQIWNRPHPDARMNLDNGSFMLPSENVAVNRVNSGAHFSMPGRSNDLQLSNVNPMIENRAMANSGTSIDPYLHPPPVRSSGQLPPNYVLHGPSGYNHLAAGDTSSTVNLQMDHGGATYKRKIPAISTVPDRGIAGGYFCTGSSSSVTVSNEHLHPKPMSGPNCWHRDPVSTAPNYRSNNLLTSIEESHRNVRSRHSHAIHMEGIPAGSHSSSNISLHFHSAPNTAAGPNVAGQWTHAPSSDPNRRMLSSDVSSMNQSMAGSSATNSSMEIDGGFNSNLILNGNSRTPLPAIYGPPTRGLGMGHNGYGERMSGYRSFPNYTSMGFAATVEDGRRTGIEVAVPPRHIRPPHVLGRSSERSGRWRNLHDRFQSFPDEGNAHRRWVSEDAAILDRSTYYDSRNLFDQHRDMRLDIDNMSYEELLALGERIGNVGTGLSKGAISRCLMETICCCPEQKQNGEEGGNCVICLEEYKGGEVLGSLHCGHDFHSSCIRKWLQIKNACPICKGSALEDTLRAK